MTTYAQHMAESAKVPNTRTIEIPNLSIEDIHGLEAVFWEQYNFDKDLMTMVAKYHDEVTQAIYGRQVFA